MTSEPGTERQGLARRALVAVGVGVLVVGAALLVREAVRVVLLAFGAVLFAIFLLAPTRWLTRGLGVGHGLALAIVIVVLLAGIGGLGWLVAPRLADEVARLADTLPRSLGQVERGLEGYAMLQRLASEARAWIAERVPSLFSNLFGGLAMLLVVIASGIYVAASPDVYRRGLVRLVPVGRRDRAREVLGALGYTLERFVAGRLVSMLAVGVLTWLGLWRLGVPLALTLGLLAGLLEFVPYAGPVVSAVPALLVAATQGGTSALYVAILYLAVQQAESYVITPLVQQTAVRLPPAVTILALVLAGSLFGSLGLLLATPLAAVVLVLVQLLYVEDALGDAADLPGERRHGIVVGRGP